MPCTICHCKQVYTYVNEYTGPGGKRPRVPEHVSLALHYSNTHPQVMHVSKEANPILDRLSQHQAGSKEHSRQQCRSHLGSVQAVSRAVSSVAALVHTVVLHLQSNDIIFSVLMDCQ